MHLSPQHQRILLDAARETIRGKLGGPSPASAQDVAHSPAAVAGAGTADDPVLGQLAGCFVTLHSRRTHELRGCVGRLDAVDPLLTAVRRSALSVLSDPRFQDNPVRPAEL